MPNPQNSARKQYVSVAKNALGILAALYLLFGLIMLGDVFRGERSPWFWTQFATASRTYGPVEVTLEMVAYSAFYAWAFLIPCGLIEVAIRFASAATGRSFWPLIDGLGLRLGIVLVSSGCGLTIIFQLPAEIAFTHRLPTSVWNGWLMILECATSVSLIFLGMASLARFIRSRRIQVDVLDDILCRCPRCENQWIFPAERLRTHGLWVRYDDSESR